LSGRDRSVDHTWSIDTWVTGRSPCSPRIIAARNHPEGDAFQRDAILALHDALTAYWQTALVAQVQIHNRPTEAGQETVDHQAIFGPVRAAYWRMSAVRTKVFDDELRRLVNELGDQIDVILSMDVQQAQGVLSESYGLLKQIGDRINALLKQLF
jgi:hypothetical protein